MQFPQRTSKLPELVSTLSRQADRSKQEAEAQFEDEQRLSQTGRLNIFELGNIPTIARAEIAERSKGLAIDRIIKTPTIFIVRIDRAGEKIEIRLTDDEKILGSSSN